MTAWLGLNSFNRLAAMAAAAVLTLQAPARAEEISVTQWGASMYGAPYAVALEKGLFKRAGIDITGIIGTKTWLDQFNIPITI